MFSTLLTYPWLYEGMLVIHVILASLTIGHALLTKRDPRSIWGWTLFCFLAPVFGISLYIILGINRIETRGRRLSRRFPDRRLRNGLRNKHRTSSASVPDLDPPYLGLNQITDALVDYPLCTDNKLDMLIDGEACYPAMLDSIQQATSRVYLQSYIFDHDTVGQQFVMALRQAHQRGVKIYVLTDGLGEMPPPFVTSQLRSEGVEARQFLPFQLFPPQLNINLRNHRKLMIIDGQHAYTGGMNISQRHLAQSDNKHRCHDVHFRCEGPIVNQLADTFHEDWYFTTGEDISDEYQVNIQRQDTNYQCRAVRSGPNEDIDILHSVIYSAINKAKKRIDIMSPYFIPSREIMAALKYAALSGVKVNIIIPDQLDIMVVKWAMRKHMLDFMRPNIKVYFQPGPFVHTKLLVIDDYYSLIGSANIDPRSLRLNFELNITTYSRPFALKLREHIDQARQRSQLITRDYLQKLPLRTRLMDAGAWVFTPYL